MNIRQVEIFQKVMSSGSVTKAAGLLCISQPAVSKHLKLMEYNVGFALFERKGNQLEPTSEALALFEQVDQVYTGMDALSRFADDLRDNQLGELTVAAMPLLAHQWLPSIIGKFAKEHPNVSLSVPIRSTEWITRAVATGRADIGLGLVRNNDTSVISAPLMKLPLVAVHEQGHKLSSNATLKFSDLVGHDLITLSNFDRWPLELNNILTSDNVRPKRRLEVFTAHIACELALHGAGVAIVDLLTAMDFQEKGLNIKRFDTDISLQIMLLRPKHRRETRVASSLRDKIIQAAHATEAQILNFLV